MPSKTLKKERYFFGGVCAGALGAGAGADCAGAAGVEGLPGVAGVVFLAGWGAFGCVSSRIEPVLKEPVGARFTESVSEVIINTMAHHVVARERKVAAPRGPKAV
jgi:hypothetical protein